MIAIGKNYLIVTMWKLFGFTIWFNDYAVGFDIHIGSIVSGALFQKNSFLYEDPGLSIRMWIIWDPEGNAKISNSYGRRDNG